MQMQSLGQEYPLKEGMATHFSILARRVPWTDQTCRSRALAARESV